MSAHRDSVLREMGLAPLWRLRAGSTAAHPASDAPAPAQNHPAVEPALDDAAGGHSPPAQAVSGRARAALAQPDPAHLPAASPTQPEIEQQLKHEHRNEHEHEPQSPSRQARAARIASLDWDALECDIRACSACPLSAQRQQAVPGSGDRNADWMLVGEGPGAEEDRQGEPFVGPAGQLLDAMLHAIGLTRGNGVYIANAVKCRPPMNRTPQLAEIDACLPYLERQIELVQPRVLVALGKPAAQALLGTDIRINAARGKIFAYKGIPVIVTYHPAYLLRNQADKAKAWQDLCFARRVMRGDSAA